MTLYTDNDPKVCQWLQNLIGAGLLDGEVLQRSIRDIESHELRGYSRVHLFAGIGGWELALRYAGWPDDVPVWTGSCPCQPFSSAGKRLGTADSRHLWPEMRRLIAECKPICVFGEQVTSHAGREWLAGVRADLEDLGYAVGAADLCAASVGQIHRRQRLWWCAYAGSLRPQRFRETQKESWTWEQFERLVQAEERMAVPAGRSGALADGVPGRVVKLRAYGNAIVPQVAATFVRAFMETM